MNDREFNLLDEPWIRVIDKECSIHEVSLIDVFKHAHTYKDLCGELPTQDFAMLRLLLAVLHTVFSRYDVNGNGLPLDSPDDALDRWAELWKNKKFPAEVIEKYLESQRENFYLFHPERPFYQCGHAKAGTEYSASKLNGNLSESSNKIRLFSEISGPAKEGMSFSEAARWLLYVNAYDDTSAKPSRESKERGMKLPSTGVGWLGKLGIIFAAGDNLFETLMLNMVILTANGEVSEEETPIWERKEIPDGERTKIRCPENLSELYTLQSRRLYLKRKGQSVTGYFLLGGDFFDRENAFIEPMTVWKNPDSKKTNTYTPRRHDSSKQFWRECPAAILNDKENRPGIISWIRQLENEKLIQNPCLYFRIVSVQYGDKDFFVTNVFSDSLQMYASLVSDMGVVWRAMVLDSIDFCDTVSKKVWSLAKDVNLASGGSSSTKESRGSSEIFAEKVKADFYNRIDGPFRRWLSTLNPEMGTESGTDMDREADIVQEKRDGWRKECVGIARQLGDEIIRQTDAAAIFGRTKPGSEDKKSKTFSAAAAMNRFLIGLSTAENM